MPAEAGGVLAATLDARVLRGKEEGRERLFSRGLVFKCKLPEAA